MWDRQREEGSNSGVVVSVQACYSSVLLKTCDCDCVNPGVPYRLCLVSVERARGSTQRLSSGHLTGSQIRGAQLAPHAWLAHDPAGQDPCLGHVQSCDPLTNWWESDSHVTAASASPSNSSSTVCNVVVPSDQMNLMTCLTRRSHLSCPHICCCAKDGNIPIQLFTM